MSLESVKNAGYEFLNASKVYLAKAYNDFDALQRGPKVDVVLKTALVVFGLGLFSSKLIAVGGGAAAFIYFGRQSIGANQENRSVLFDFVEQHVANVRRWIDGGTFFEQPADPIQEL